MLKFLIQVANDLFTISIVIGFVISFLKVFYGDKGKKIGYIGTLSGLFLALTRSIIFNNTRIKNSWRIGFIVNIIAVILFIFIVIALILSNVKSIKEKLNNKNPNIISMVIPILIIVDLSAFIFNTINDVWYYPIKFYDSSIGILSTEYLLNLLGYIFGVVGAITLGICSYKIGNVLDKKGFKKLFYVITSIIFSLYTLYVFGKLSGSLVTRNFIKIEWLSDILFKFSIFSGNNQRFYGYINIATLILLGVFLWVKSYTVKEKYKNNAEFRKLKVVWRTAKRVCVTSLFALVLFILCQTLFVKIITVVIVDTPLESPMVVKDGSGNDSELWIPVRSVNDMHLHKFEYVTTDGYKTRVVVILKQENTNNFGIGLDACEICGEAGYYENNENQVVCKKCGVVMNTTTIGMKGGCNPIIIDYDYDDTFTYIIIPVSEMVNNQTKFSK